MAIVAELRLAGPGLFLGRASRAVPEAVFEIEYEAGHGEVLLSAHTDDVDALEAAFEADPTVAECTHLVEHDGRHLYRVGIDVDRPFFTRLTMPRGIRIVENSLVEGEWYMTLELPDQDALSGIGAFCEEHGISMHVECLYVERQPDTVGRFGLTAAQHEALVVAHERGYFNDPRDVTLEELAAELDVSATALGRRMRRALDSLIERTLRTDGR